MINANDVKLENGNVISVMKKPIAVKAIEMPDEFTVTTLEGEMKGKKGDFLMVGARGERYPIDREIFYQTYEKV